MINILILAAGRVEADVSSNAIYPACLTELDGVSVLEKIISHVQSIEGAKFTFALHAGDVTSYHLDSIANLLVPNACISIIPENTMGSACTALLAACELDMNIPLLILSANEIVDHDLGLVVAEFKSNNLDAGTIVFRSVHPRYSYVKVDQSGMVTEASQQNPISKIATTGVFWYAKTSDFISTAKNLIRKNAATNGKFYLAPVFNELILKNKKVGVYEVNKDKYTPLKNASQIQQYESGQI